MQRTSLFLAVALAGLTLPSCAQDTVRDRSRLFKPGAIRVLILTGQNNHDWRTTTPLLKSMLLNTGRFDVRINEEPTGMTSDTLSVYDVVVLNYNGPRWGKTAETALENFVRSGKGLVAMHGANWSFSGLVVLGDNSVPTGIMEPPWAQYKLMVGGVWSDQDPASGHAARHTFMVQVVDPHNPITEQLPSSFEADDELYHNIHMVPGVHVLATAYDDPNNQPKPEHSGQENTQTAQVSKSASQWPRLDMNPTGKNEPMLWTLAYGRGRSFYTALGHDTRAMAMPGFSTTFVRGVEWAARGTVRKPEPDFRSWAEAPFARRP